MHPWWHWCLLCSLAYIGQAAGAGGIQVPVLVSCSEQTENKKTKVGQLLRQSTRVNREVEGAFTSGSSWLEK